MIPLPIPELLDKLLDQYLSHEKPESNLKSVRSKLIKFVINCSDSIRVESLRDAKGRTLEDSEEEYNHMRQRFALIAWPSAKCFACNTDICQVHCANCNVYMCKNHWWEHMLHIHPAMAKKYSLSP